MLLHGIAQSSRNLNATSERPRLPNGASELSEPLPDWVTQAHLKWLETGEGDPWGGHFS
jgi:hypothetical protein